MDLRSQGPNTDGKKESGLVLGCVFEREEELFGCQARFVFVLPTGDAYDYVSLAWCELYLTFANLF